MRTSSRPIRATAGWWWAGCCAAWCSPPISARSRCCCRATSRARAARCTSATSARAHTALPFLIFDADPYMVIDGGGRLRWILDAYTATTRYPYAQPLSNGVNYMRNSVKVVIDAYDGSVTAYQADSADPLVRTFAKIFPGIFHPLDSMPADLRAHLRYPEDLFHVQTRSEEHTSELQSLAYLVCRLLLEKKNTWPQYTVVYMLNPLTLGSLYGLKLVT